MNASRTGSESLKGFVPPIDKSSPRHVHRDPLSTAVAEAPGALRPELREAVAPVSAPAAAPTPVTVDAIEEQPTAEAPARPEDQLPPRQLLSIDIGGTKIKVLATGQTEPRKIASGRRMTPAKMVAAVRELTEGWEYDAISIGYPGLVGQHGPRSEPGNLGSGWVGFDFASAFEKPVRIVNDAAMQALGSYEGGRMLFLGLGTGLGSALIANGSIVSLELGNLMHSSGQSLGDLLGRNGLLTVGKKAWRDIVGEVVPMLMGALIADDLVLGGGNSKLIRGLPPGARLGHNLTAFRGGFRLWHLEDLPTLNAGVVDPVTPSAANWRMV